MKVSISQPTLFPWLGYYNIIKKSDVFVFLDNVKFEKRSWQMRNKLKLISSGTELETWIRIPTKLVTSSTLIKDVLIDNNQDWRAKHTHSFTSNYNSSYKEINFIQEIYDKTWEKLADFNIEFITKSCKFLDIDTKLTKASDLGVQGKKGDLLLDICKKFSATEYLSTEGSRDYLKLEEEKFKEEKIKISYNQFDHPIYKQRGKTFLEKLCILDLIFNEKENSKKFV